MHGPVDDPHSCASTNCLLEVVSTLLPPQPKDGAGGGSSLCCPVCESPPLQPTTLPCGHTVCRCCVVAGSGCPRCGAAVPATGVATNVLAQALVERWWPAEMNAGRLREAAMDLVQAGRVAAAVDKLDQAVSIGMSFIVHSRMLTLCLTTKLILSSPKGQTGRKRREHISVSTYCRH